MREGLIGKDEWCGHKDWVNGRTDYYGPQLLFRSHILGAFELSSCPNTPGAYKVQMEAAQERWVLDAHFGCSS